MTDLDKVIAYEHSRWRPLNYTSGVSEVPKSPDISLAGETPVGRGISQIPLPVNSSMWNVTDSFSSLLITN